MSSVISVILLLTGALICSKNSSSGCLKPSSSDGNVLGMRYGNFQEISGFQHLRAGYSVQTWILFITGALLQSYCVHGLGMQTFSPLFAPTHLRLMDH